MIKFIYGLIIIDLLLLGVVLAQAAVFIASNAPGFIKAVLDQERAINRMIEVIQNLPVPKITIRDFTFLSKGKVARTEMTTDSSDHLDRVVRAISRKKKKAVK